MGKTSPLPLLTTPSEQWGALDKEAANGTIFKIHDSMQNFVCFVCLTLSINHNA
jgi:hypothetical protein